MCFSVNSTAFFFYKLLETVKILSVQFLFLKINPVKFSYFLLNLFLVTIESLRDKESVKLQENEALNSRKFR